MTQKSLLYLLVLFKLAWHGYSFSPCPVHHRLPSVEYASNTSPNSHVVMFAKKTKKNRLMDDFTTADGFIVNPYATLDVERHTPQDEVRSSYLHLSKLYHPDAMIRNDKFPENCKNIDQVREEWERIKLSYEILTDKKLKLKYDIAALSDPDILGKVTVEAAKWSVSALQWSVKEVSKHVSNVAENFINTSIHQETYKNDVDITKLDLSALTWRSLELEEIANQISTAAKQVVKVSYKKNTIDVAKWSAFLLQHGRLELQKASENIVKSAAHSIVTMSNHRQKKSNNTMDGVSQTAIAIYNHLHVARLNDGKESQIKMKTGRGLLALPSSIDTKKTPAIAIYNHRHVARLNDAKEAQIEMKAGRGLLALPSSIDTKKTSLQDHYRVKQALEQPKHAVRILKSAVSVKRVNFTRKEFVNTLLAVLII